ncbi:TonB-dependent receptor [Parasphingorhabdus cellanae]|uniref:TonB-dependent receptor n=1 Tax=Parasphingorhabdus cellanae TaxID=2806553 RepID=A0ABX7T7Z9_9SPHN|nr:TonB-dependent receptor [Parasphingorhabdus cellanae]QTD57631.1 TonB-dependent receptor [Parasphingorhabdus cellanae]
MGISLTGAKGHMPFRMKALRASFLVSAVCLVPANAWAQDAQQEAAQDQRTDDDGTIVVTGEISRTIENSLATKRDLSVIGDAIVGEDIGDLPDLSVAETLERVAGVTSDRFKGGASELSVRGLGAFLGASYFNGREISSGSDGRDVNFGQFPSELINGAVVYKTQQASFIEGGVSGIIELQTLRPLDYGKSRLQIQGLAGYSDYEDKVVGGNPVNYRLTGSYVDQFSTGIGEIGIAIGGQIRRDTAPEDIFTSSSTYRPCNTIEGVDRSNNCSFLTDGDGNPTGASDTYFVSNQYIFRAQATDADRDAVIGSIQWQPSPDLEFNFDGQYSYRDDIEERANLVIADGRRDITPIEISPTGALLAWSGESRLENQTVWRQRTEEYIGLGGNVEWTSDRLILAADIGFSQTKRRQDELDMRIRTNSRVLYEIDRRGQTVPALTLTDVSAVENNTGLTFDLDNHDLYDNGARARRRLENVDDEIFSVRLDATYEMESFLTSIQAGVRYGDRRRVRDDGIDSTLDLQPDGYFSDAAIAARQGFFLVQDLFDGADTPTEGLTFANWDARPLFAALTGDPDAGLPTGSTLSTQDADVSEETFAGYLQANFDAELFGAPVTGNFGLRAIRTKISSVGVSSALVTSPGPDPDTITVTEVGDPIVNVETNSFWNFLPSANITFEIADDKLLRLAAYRAIARPDPEAMSAALSFDDEADLGDLGSIVSASGNPFLEPLESWNADISFEWYASPTSSLAIAAYYKSLQTGFQTDVTNLTLNVDGAPTDVVIGRTANSNDKSTLYGFEITAQHKFDWLPSPLDGFGFQASYNFADSNFEFPDPIVVSGNALADFTEPANIPGYSKHSANATLYYEHERFSARLAYKYRSDYFKPFRTSANRFTKDQGFLDFSASLNLMKGVQMRFQVLNILDEPNIFYRPTSDSLAQADYSGTRYFIGLRTKL